MAETIAQYVQYAAEYAHFWGFFLIFLFMTVESSFIPFPSEVVMIPAGFLAYRGELTTGVPWLDLTLAIFFGLAGSMAGSYVNYGLALRLGRPFLYRFGRYFFLPKETLDRAEEIFLRYGELTTFVCRLLPAIRQLISLPAGLVRMDLRRFSLFTALGAGIWTAILAFTGWYFAHLAGNITYPEMIERGTRLISDNYIWIFLGLAAIVAAYFILQRFIMKPAARHSALTE